MHSVVIPVYKSQLNEQEYASLIQCLSVFCKQQITIIAPNDLDLRYYSKLFYRYNKDLLIEYFDPFFFENIAGYNRLMLSPSFYERFLLYDYILIYQLDAYVFRDELNCWVSKGYDYIGAPCCFVGPFVWDKAMTGNGGFSLRSTHQCFSVLSTSRPLLSYKSLRKMYENTVCWKRSLLAVLGLFGYKNNSNYFVNLFDMNEDFFWSLLKDSKFIDFKIPSKDVSISFCFEQSPSQLFEINNGRLPFGSHAYYKYEYDCFWKYWIFKN